MKASYAILTGACCELLGSEEYTYTAELKLDGLSMAVHYEDGRLRQAITRGDRRNGRGRDG